MKAVFNPATTLVLKGTLQTSLNVMNLKEVLWQLLPEYFTYQKPFFREFWESRLGLTTFNPAHELSDDVESAQNSDNNDATTDSSVSQDEEEDFDVIDLPPAKQKKIDKALKFPSN